MISPTLRFLTISMAACISACNPAEPPDAGAVKGGLASGAGVFADTASVQYAQQFIEVSDLVAKKGNVEGHAYVGVKLKNIGEKTVPEIKLTVYFYDNEGTIIYEDSIEPLDLYFAARSSSPLKPGYVRELRVNEEFIIGNIPSDWSGEISGKITGLSFE